MIRINQCKVSVPYTMQDVEKKVSQILHCKSEDIQKIHIVKESLDARKKPALFYSLVLDVACRAEEKLLRNTKSKDVQPAPEKKYRFPVTAGHICSDRPVIIGAGPAGLVCAYYLAKAGRRPIVLERGRSVEQRKADIDRFWETGVLDTTSNVQFGEGGAGTFSDGKLNTLNKDPFGYQKEVFRLFVEMGAKPEIQYQQKPHVGTDALFQIVRNLRNAIRTKGGDIYFESQMTDIFFTDCTDDPYNRKVCGIEINHKDRIDTDHIILAIGHSARDTFRMLNDHRIPMEAKSFAVGYRVQHLQKDMDKAQYGEQNVGLFPPAAYKVTAQSQNKRGVYSFCMCPGGYVVNASSEKNRLCVNGMSYSDRAGDNANSAIIISVSPDDYPDEGPLSGVKYQEMIEEKAYQVCGGRIPVQCYADYKADRISTGFGSIRPQIKGQYSFGNLRNIYSQEIEQAFMDGMSSFGRKIKGFDADDVLITGVEPRTSSPVRIHRGKDLQSITIKGLYPCGEGAGYAGGITSAACDGLKIALKIITSLGDKT